MIAALGLDPIRLAVVRFKSTTVSHETVGPAATGPPDPPVDAAEDAHAGNRPPAKAVHGVSGLDNNGSCPAKRGQWGRLEEQRMNDANSPWQPPDAKRPAPTASSFEPPGPSWSRGTLVAVVGAGVGWGIVVFYGMARLFSDEETNCTARRGSAYQDCLRSSDLNGLGAQALALGLAVMGCVLIARDARRSSLVGQRQLGRNAAVAVSGSLLVISVALWIWGLHGGWAPDRPFNYEPVPHSTANTIMVTGLLTGAAVGGFWPLARTKRAG